MTVSFEHPRVLFLLVLIPFVILFFHKGRRFSSPKKGQWILTLRILITALLICAVASPVFTRYANEQYFIFLLDVSDSLRGLGIEKGREFIDQALAPLLISMAVQ